MEEPKPQSMQRSRGQDSQVGGTMQVLYLLLCTVTSVSCAKLWEFLCSTKAQRNWNKLSLILLFLIWPRVRQRKTWEWIWSVWESSCVENHVCFLSAFCKSICVLCRSFQASFSLILMLARQGILTKWTPSVRNWCRMRGGEAESEAENEERNVKTLAMD